MKLRWKYFWGCTALIASAWVVTQVEVGGQTPYARFRQAGGEKAVKDAADWTGRQLGAGFEVAWNWTRRTATNVWASIPEIGIKSTGDQSQAPALLKKDSEEQPSSVKPRPSPTTKRRVAILKAAEETTAEDPASKKKTQVEPRISQQQRKNLDNLLSQRAQR